MMHKKRLFIFALGLVLMAGFFQLPKNRRWLSERILSYYSDLPEEIHHLDEETRMRRRFDNSYTLSKNIAAELIQKGGNRQSLILVPPPAYFKKMGIDYPVPEPAVFYYFTGSKTIWASSKKAIEAGWYAHVQQGKIVVDSVIDRKSFQDTITMLRKWRYPL